MKNVIIMLAVFKMLIVSNEGYWICSESHKHSSIKVNKSETIYIEYKTLCQKFKGFKRKISKSDTMK